MSPCVSPCRHCVSPQVSPWVSPCRTLGIWHPSPLSTDLPVLSCPLWQLRPHNLGCAHQAPTCGWDRRGPLRPWWTPVEGWPAARGLVRLLVPRSRDACPVPSAPPCAGPCPGWTLLWSQERSRKHKRQDGKLKPSQLTCCCDGHGAHRQMDTRQTSPACPPSIAQWEEVGRKKQKKK